MPLEMHELLLVFVVTLGTLGLQIFLSLRNESYWGLIIPILIVAYSLYKLLSTDFFFELTSNYYKFASIAQACIPAILLLIVHFICRKTRKNE